MAPLSSSTPASDVLRPDAPTVRAALPMVAIGAVMLLWGIGPPMSKYVTAPSLTIVFVRLWMAVPVMFALQAKAGSRPSVEQLKRTALGGVMFGLNMVAFFASLKEASIATLTVIGSLQPGFVMLGASRFFGERLTRWGVSFTVVGIVGAAIAVLGAGGGVRSTPIGVFWSALSMVAMCVYFLAGKQARSDARLSATDYIAGVMLWAAIAVTPFSILLGGLGRLDAIGRADVMWMTLVLIGPGVAGHLLLSWALRYVPVSVSSTAMLGSTVISIAAAWPLHDQPVTAVQALGGAIALGGVAAVTLRRA